MKTATRRPSEKVKAEKVQRQCALPTCNEYIAGNRKFCSSVHKNAGMRKDVGVVALGRPSLYETRFSFEVMDEYLDECEERSEDLVPTESSFVVLKRAKIPCHEGFKRHLQKKYGVRVNVRIFEAWALKHEEFAEALDSLMSLQKEMMISGGVSGQFSPQSTKFILINNHGMVERTEVDTTHKLLGVVKHVYGRADTLEKPEQRPKSDG